MTPPLARRVVGLFRAATAAVSSPWRPAGEPYPALATFAVRTLSGQPGVYAVWHLGVRARWLRIGGGADLAGLVAALQQHADLRAAEAHGGVFLAWAPLPFAEIAGAVGSLIAQVSPSNQDFVLAGESVAGAVPAVPFPLPPGTRTVTPEKS